MNWIRLHHPDISLPVIRRRAGIEIIEMLEVASSFFTQGSWGLVNRSCYPNRSAYSNATSRLHKHGLIIKRSQSGKTPRLLLSEAGKNSLQDYFSPEKKWKQKWNNIWYLLVYDVPEVDRKYRNVLRQFLKRLHMGCLQQSVWVTPHDIRPDFDDLATAANIGTFAYLFESRTVLGLSNRQIICDAWDFDHLYSIQELYCSVMEQNITHLKTQAFNAKELAELIQIALNAYHSAFAEDPLLPKTLHPADYLGIKVLATHRSLFHLIDQQLSNLPVI